VNRLLNSWATPPGHLAQRAETLGLNDLLLRSLDLGERRLQLTVEATVLEGDGRLVSKGLDKPYLFGVEHVSGLVPNAELANHSALDEQRHAQQSSERSLLDVRP